MNVPDVLAADEIPQRLVASYATSFGEEGRAWIAQLPSLTADILERWQLRRDGAAWSGQASLVLPVLRHDGQGAVLKLQLPREETAAALIGLRTWNGEGMVRLLDYDPASSSMLLERLDGARTLASVDDDDVAMGILAGLHARLVAVPAPQGLRGLGDVAAEMLEQAPQAITHLTDPADRRLLRGWASAVAELAGDPGDRLLHWDLHYDNILAAQREPWLAIDPEPLAGDPGFDLWPALDSRWDIEDGETRLAPSAVTMAEALRDR
ncbi:aminoglycoside phosphotransferase family protein [Streptomyces sp. NPDC059258]|uniref:aminoglycoside phosphotransferase family protein n=1 Tax=unclassified Streptomyces TaxID=2593676 RepID=UPI003691F1FA